MTQSPPLDAVAAIVFAAIAIAAFVTSRRWMWPAPAVVAFTAPFAWYHSLGPTEITVSKAAFVGAGLGVIAAIARDSERRRFAVLALRTTPALLPLVALAVWSACSMWWAATPADALRDALKWSWYAGVFALTVVSLGSAEDRNRVLLGLFAASLLVGVYGLYQNATSPPAAFVAPSGAVVGRIAATLEGPNQFGGYLEAVLPTLVAVLLGARLAVWPLVTGGLLCGVLLSDLLLTYSRGALWASAIALLVVVAAAWAARRAGAGFGRAALVTAACTAVVVIPMAVSSIDASGWQHELWAPGVGDTSVSAARRVQLWTCATRLFEAHPIAGVGAGNFADVKDACGRQLAGDDHSNANQLYLEIAADTGVIGLAVLVGFVALVLAGGRHAALWREPARVGAYAAFVAFALHGLVDDVVAYPKAALSFFVLAAIVAARDAPRPTGQASQAG